MVPSASALALAVAVPSSALRLLPDTNHVLKRVTSDSPSANPATYGDPNLPLALGVADAIATFVTTSATVETGKHRR